jgi:uncharacterized protein YndB with AHSA1/START domain
MKITRTVPAPRSAVFAAFLDPDAIVAWLPPAGMTGEMHRFDARPGGGYAMTLRYERPGPEIRGKTTADADTVEVRFAEIVPDVRLVQAIDFASEDPSYTGTMTMTWTFADAPGGTDVAVEVANAPPGIAEADHEIGIRSSLENLCCYLKYP